MMYESRLYAFMDQSTFSGIIWRILWGISVALSSFRDHCGWRLIFCQGPCQARPPHRLPGVHPYRRLPRGPIAKGVAALGRRHRQCFG